MFAPKVFASLVFVILIAADSVISTESELIINLSHGGSLAGTYFKTEKGRSVRSFLGIPYAKPPIGELRFESPQPFPAWEGIRNATQDGPICVQSNILSPDGKTEGSEDCLYMNVFTPPLSKIPKGGLPVMFWIHGGGFMGGSSYSKMQGPDYILDHDVILVGFNYRLSILGFMSSETLDCSGNFGLKDQVEALKWVKNHISSFGGNPNSVIIGGISAGGASVSYLLQSDKARGLFHKAIQQSGTIFNSWSQPLHKGVAQGRAIKIAKAFNCYTENEDWKQIISCMKKIDAVELTSKIDQLLEWLGYPYFIFQPVIEPFHEEAFIYEYPRDVPLNSLDIPLLTGVTSSEGLMSTVPFLGKEDLLKILKSNIEEKFPLMLSYDHWDKKKQQEITKEFENFYLKNGHNYHKFDHRNFTDEILKALLSCSEFQMFSDSLFVAGFDEYLEKRLTTKSAVTYTYVFDFASKNSISKIFGGEDFYYGVSHGDDMQMLFPLHRVFGWQPSKDKNEAILIEAFVEMWVNFATYGNPTPDNKYGKWEPATKYPWNFARIGSIDENGFTILKNEDNYALDRMQFWKHIKPHRENVKIEHTEL